MISKLPAQLQAVAYWVENRYRTAAADEDGISTVELVIIISVVVALAIAITAIIVTKVTNKAHNINLGH